MIKANSKRSLFVAVFTVMSLVSCAADTPPSASDYLGATTFANPAVLEKEVDRNSVAFEEKYDRKYILVIGSVEGINPDKFTVARRYQYYNQDVGISVPETARVGCSVRSDKRSGLSSLREGQGVIAAGRVDFSAGGIFKSINLRDCVWVPADGSYDLNSAKNAIKTTL